MAAVKSGTISLNAAAAVATLPAEEQVAAATAGKDELKQSRQARARSQAQNREEAAPKIQMRPRSPLKMRHTDELPALRARAWPS